MVDDLHLADGASLRWLAHLARRLDEQPVLIVTAARTGEPRIQRHAILPDRWQPGDELTDTLKLRRQWIAAKYAAQITSLYS